MYNLLNVFKKKKTAVLYITSGLLLTASQALSGFVVLRWLEPSLLGQWDSFVVFAGYIHILTLGTTNGLGRELPYWLGKGNIELGLKRLKTTGYFTTLLSISIMIFVLVIGLILFLTNLISLKKAILFFFSFSISALAIQTNFLGATYRSAQSFEKLGLIQLFNSLLYFLLIPLIYFFNLWGYIVYQVLLAFALYIGYRLFRPYKVHYKFEMFQFKELINVGLPIYFWNYIISIILTIPRLILIIFGSPFLVGLYSPAGSVNIAMLKLPGYINRYLFPKMSFMLGQNENPKQVFKYTIKASKLLFFIMMVSSLIIAIFIPTIFHSFFPQYIEGIIPAQITIFSGVFYSINSLMHIGMNSLKIYKPFKYIASLRFFYIIVFSYISYLITDNLLLAVSFGAVCSEIFNMISYFYFFKKAV